MPGTVYGFGPFQLDPARRALGRDDAPVALPPKAFDALLFLVENRDRVVTKEELMARLWPDVAVEEASLAQQIFVIRKALGESAEGRTYVATVPRRGYRFVADVEELHTSRPAAPGGGALRRVGGPVAMAAVLATLAIAASLRTLENVPAPMVLEVVPPEGLVLSNSIALSPDGKYLAFTAAGEDGTSNVWLRAIGSEEVRRLAGTDDALYPFWSPDSESIAFFASGKLKRLDLAGGPVRVLNENTPFPRGGTWGDRGTIVFVPSGRNVLYRIPAQGGPAEAITAIGMDESDHRWPAFLPGGTAVVFMVWHAREDRQELAVARTDGAGVVKHHVLTVASSQGFYSDGHLFFLRGRTLFSQPLDANRLELRGAASAVRADVWKSAGFSGLQGCTAAASALVACRTGLTDPQFVWVDRKGNLTGKLAPRYVGNPQLSPDANMVVVNTYDDEAGHDVLGLIDLARDTVRHLHTGNVESAVWSPDGRNIAFAADVNGVFEPHLLELPAARERVLWRTTEWTFPMDWSRDGRWLLYQDARGYLLARSLTHERAAPVMAVPEPSVGRLSADGHWIAYAAATTGRDEIYVRGFPEGAGPWQVSSNGGTEPRWRSDGREIYYVRPDRHLMAVVVEQRERALWFTKERVLFEPRTYSTGYAFSYDVAPGGDRFLITQFRDRGRIAVMLNWRAPASTPSSPVSRPAPR